jgi:hypothetical protein
MEPHPIRLVVTDDLRRSRLTVFFRLLLAIPHFVWISLWSIAAYVVLVVNWFATLIKGTSPQGLHNFLAAYTIYSTRVSAYAFLLANPYPPFRSSGTYDVDLQIDPPARQNRLTVFFRVIMAIPAWILATVLYYVLEIIAFLCWFIALALGRVPEGMRNLGAFCLAYYQQTNAYAFLLTGRYPSLSWEGPRAPAPAEAPSWSAPPPPPPPAPEPPPAAPEAGGEAAGRDEPEGWRPSSS